MSISGKLRRQLRARARREVMTVEDSTLYKANGEPVTLSDNDSEYRRAYRNLFRRLGFFPPDGIYNFDGKKMWAAGWRPTERKDGRSTKETKEN